MVDKTKDLMGKFLENCFEQQAKMIESLALPYLQYTGLAPDQIELVQKTEGAKTVWYFRQKGSNE